MKITDLENAINDASTYSDLQYWGGYIDALVDTGNLNPEQYQRLRELIDLYSRSSFNDE
jgi:hypothetical protein